LDLERITGFTLTQLLELTRQIRILMGDVVKPRGRAAAIDLTRSVALVVHLLRHNVTQDVAGATFGVSQSTVSRRWDENCDLGRTSVSTFRRKVVDQGVRIVRLCSATNAPGRAATPR
jgi:hypothetical protein